jgi:hypothetical protein
VVGNVGRVAVPVAVARVVLALATVTSVLLRAVRLWWRVSGAIVVDTAESSRMRDGIVVYSSTSPLCLLQSRLKYRELKLLLFALELDGQCVNWHCL